MTIAVTFGPIYYLPDATHLTHALNVMMPDGIVQCRGDHDDDGTAVWIINVSIDLPEPENFCERIAGTGKLLAIARATLRPNAKPA